MELFWARFIGISMVVFFIGGIGHASSVSYMWDVLHSQIPYDKKRKKRIVAIFNISTILLIAGFIGFVISLIINVINYPPC